MLKREQGSVAFLQPTSSHRFVKCSSGVEPHGLRGVDIAFVRKFIVSVAYTRSTAEVAKMSEIFVNTVQFRFPMGAPQPSWPEIADFVKKLESDVLEMETCYRISDNKCVYIKYKSLGAMEDTMRRNTETSKFRYESGKVVEVQMSIAGSNVRYVRVFDLPPEIADNDVSLELGKYGTVERTIREKFPEESGLGHMCTGIRGVYIDLEEDIPPTLVIANRKGKVFYDGLRNKCFLCLLEGHRRDSCPSRKMKKHQEKQKCTETEQTSSYAAVVETGAASPPDEMEIVEEENTDATSETEERQNGKTEYKNHMDQVCHEKYGITDYTEKLAQLNAAVQEHVRQQESATNQRKTQLTKSRSIEHSPPKKNYKKSSK